MDGTYQINIKLTKSNVIVITGNSKHSPICSIPNTVSIHQHLLPNLSTVATAKYLDAVLDNGLPF